MLTLFLCARLVLTPWQLINGRAPLFSCAPRWAMSHAYIVLVCAPSCFHCSHVCASSHCSPCAMSHNPLCAPWQLISVHARACFQCDESCFHCLHTHTHTHTHTHLLPHCSSYYRQGAPHPLPPSSCRHTHTHTSIVLML
jgi:hypothetical protein